MDEHRTRSAAANAGGEEARTLPADCRATAGCRPRKEDQVGGQPQHAYGFAKKAVSEGTTHAARRLLEGTVDDTLARGGEYRLRARPPRALTSAAARHAEGIRSMDVGDLRSLYLSGLREACDCEAQTIECLPMMAASAGSAELRSVMRQHVGWTTLHARQVEAILRRHGTRPKPGHDQVAAAMAGKAREITCGLGDPDLRDAALIAMARCVGHHQIAAYSAAEGYADALRLAIDRHSLLAILQQKRFVDHQLSGLQGEANQMALLVSPLSC